MSPDSPTINVFSNADSNLLLRQVGCSIIAFKELGVFQKHLPCHLNENENGQQTFSSFLTSPGTQHKQPFPIHFQKSRNVLDNHFWVDALFSLKTRIGEAWEMNFTYSIALILLFVLCIICSPVSCAGVLTNLKIVLQVVVPFSSIFGVKTGLYRQQFEGRLTERKERYCKKVKTDFNNNNVALTLAGAIVEHCDAIVLEVLRVCLAENVDGKSFRKIREKGLWDQGNNRQVPLALKKELSVEDVKDLTDNGYVATLETPAAEVEPNISICEVSGVCPTDNGQCESFQKIQEKLFFEKLRKRETPGEEYAATGHPFIRRSFAQMDEFRGDHVDVNGGTSPKGQKRFPDDGKL